MSAKENAAVSLLLELLESRYAMRVLWALKDGHPQTFRLLQDSIGHITPNTLNTRIKELRAAGLLSHGHQPDQGQRQQRHKLKKALSAARRLSAANSPP
ncbi:MAG: winged helix-turn-helix transcriptional regulator [Polaromonas sp.]|nr:winged helix-turn-helix transcriptional regulator [Polaromonas sp.]